MRDLSIELPDAEAQCVQLAEQLRPRWAPHTVLVGIYSGGAWVVERVRQYLDLSQAPGLVDVSFYRDDFAQKGLHSQLKPSSLPFPVEGQHIILVDDVLNTGRTARAALNEIFDYGRPAKVELAVLADRGGRQLPITAQYWVWECDLERKNNLVLTCDAAGRLSWKVDHA